MSMGVVTTITSAVNGLDSLLLTFEDAKVRAEMMGGRNG